jgi:hypothetical protein
MVQMVTGKVRRPRKRAVLQFTLADARAAVALLSKETPDYAAE